ncbi:MAG TPA: TonB-dependent receptor [Saprospiraceae bacterium]|nr:TonB-dependent receptor [Saprospiraceae bacterium]
MKQSVFVIFLMIFVFISSIAYGQKGNIHGFVKEAETGDAMIGASVFIKGTSTGTVTDFNGEFTLSGIKEGEVTVEFSYLGFSPLTKVVTVTSGGTQELDIAMEYEAVSLIEGEVVVTAQASAQMAAINKQRSSKTIANVISVKRIQELPDANAAEVVGRLPGVSLVREGGEGSKVVVRGLAPKYNNVTLEGVRMTSTGSDDRSTDMSMISPFMLEGIEVFKAALPDKEADAHGGTINFVLKEAPNKFRLNAYVSGGTSLLSHHFDNKVVLGMSNRFFNNKLGIFIQGDYENRNRTSHSLFASYVPQTPIDIDSEIRGSIIALKDVNRDINRKGGALVMDYKIPNGSIKFSNFGSSIGKNYLNRIETYGLVYDRHAYIMERAKTDLLVATNALSFKKTLGSFNITLKGSRAYSKDNAPKSNSITALEDGSAFREGVNKEGSVKGIISYAKNDFAAARLEKISLRDAYTKGVQYSIGGDVEYFQNISKDLSFSVKVGGKYKKLTKEHDRNNKNIPISWGQHGAPLRQAIAGNYENIDTSNTISYQYFVDKNYDSSQFLKGEYALYGPMNLADAIKIADIADSKDLYLQHYPTTHQFDYSGHEEYLAGYMMFDFKYKKNVTLTPGFRYEENTTTYTGVKGNELPLNEYVGYQYTNVTTTRNNHFLLPMVHLKINPKEWLNIRMAYTQTLSRPDFSKIVPSSNVKLTSVSWNNPYLEPSKSTNLDLYVSAYRSKLGLVSVGVFQKEIKNLIFNAGLSHIHDATEYGLSPAQNGKTITRIINNKYPLKLWGLESEYKTRLWYLDNFLKGLVLNFNYTHIFSEVRYPITQIESKFSAEPPFVVYTNIDTFYTAKFINQPDDIFNATVGYDFKGFSARLSYLYRTSIFSRAEYWTGLRAQSEAFSRWDLSLKQDLPKGFEVMLNFANIFSKPERVLLIESGFSVDEQYYGTTIDLGIRYRFP